ncbi:MAG: pyrroloquinoline quinone biosynthesis peptide chaperone PqqD [Amphritea sp.]
MTTAQHTTLEASYIINPLFLFRWEDSQNAHVLLYPEGIVKLNDTAAAILKYCTGEYTVNQSIDALTDEFEGAERETIAQSVVKFLEVSRDKGWIKLNN